MSTDKVTQVKAVLGAVAMSSFAVLTPSANAKTLDSSQSFQNILTQAKLNFNNQNQQLEQRTDYSSLKKFDASFKTALPWTCCKLCGCDDDLEDLETNASLTSDQRTNTLANLDRLDSGGKTGGCL